MAEVFGAVASAVALLHLVAKGARTLRSIPEIENDFKELCEEIDTIDSCVKNAQLTIPSAAAGLIKTQIERTAERLELICKDLERVEAKLTKEVGDGTFKVKKARWLIKTGTSATLLQRARNAKQDLMFAVQWQQHAMMDHLSTAMANHFLRDEQTNKVILSQMYTLADKLPPSNAQPGEPQRVQELPDSWTEADERQESRKAQNVDERPNAPSHREDRTLTQVFPLHSRPASALKRIMASACPEDCHCGCHTSHKRHQNEGFVGGVLNYMGVRYDLPSRDAGQDARCVCSGRTWRVEYRPPAWMEARVWLLSWNLGAAGSMYSLRAARVIPYTAYLWGHMRGPAERVQRLITNGEIVVYPDDRNEAGVEMAEALFTAEAFDVLELLFTEWKGVLRRTGFSQRAGWAANLAIERGKDTMDEKHLDLLHDVVSYSEASDEPGLSPLHVAAKKGHGVLEALQSHGWARDMFDHTRRAPLHWAVEGCHLEALQHLINAGADVNIRDGKGQTALMIAAKNPSTDCAQLLLEAGCRTSLTDMFGNTALNRAAYVASSDIVGMILRAEGGRETTAAVANLGQRWPLHELALSIFADTTVNAIEETARLLLDAYPGAMEARDLQGISPAIYAACWINHILLRYLIRAGASLTGVDDLGRNLLHWVAGRSNFYTISVLYEDPLAKEQLSIIDHRLRDADGDTSWDLFVCCMHLPPWQLGDHRHAGVHIQSAFVDLYRLVRDGNIRREVQTVQEAVDALQEGNNGAARDVLHSLASHEASSGRKNMAAWYRGFAKQVDVGEIEVVITGLKDDLRELEEEIQSSPWDQHSPWDQRAGESQWYEVSHRSFWVEPLAALTRNQPRQPTARTNEQPIVQSAPSRPRDALQSVSSDTSLNFDLVSRVYSYLGEVVYDRETASVDPREFFEQYETDS